MTETFWILVAFVIGFVVAQVWKLIVGLIRREKREKRNLAELIGYLTRSGGMPSGHAASMVAATTVLMGLEWGSAAMMVMLCVDFVVIYDAVNVRQAVGEQGRVLKEMGKKVRIVDGHKVGEVAVGAVLGIVIGMMILMILGKF